MTIGGIQNIQPSFANTFGKTALYITNPSSVPQALSRVSCGSATGRVYMGVFISELEHAFFVKHGAVKFEELLERKEVDVYELRRPSSI